MSLIYVAFIACKNNTCLSRGRKAIVCSITVLVKKREDSVVINIIEKLGKLRWDDKILGKNTKSSIMLLSYFRSKYVCVFPL